MTAHHDRATACPAAPAPLPVPAAGAEPRWGPTPRGWAWRVRASGPGAVGGLVAVLALAGVFLVAPSAVAPGAASAAPVAAVAQVSTAPRAVDALAGVAVRGKGPLTGYSRAQFGQAWFDVDRNGCDTRNDVLRRDLTEVVLKARSCAVATGTLAEPYGGAVVHFVRGVTTSTLVQVDHSVALADAWKSGAAQWTPQQRLAFANDPLELVAAGGRLNQQKKAGDAATWLPPNTAYRCEYVARQVAVKVAYGLSMTQVEKDATSRVLAACPDQRLPVAADPS